MIDLIFYKRFSFDLAQYLARRNSIHRFNLRQIEKNRFPIKCPCVVCGEHFLCTGIDQYLQRQHYGGGHVCYGCDLKNKVRLSAASLFHLISAIPQAERDQAGIYPNDFRFPRLPLWREEKMLWPGVKSIGRYRIDYWRRKWPAKECEALFDHCQGHKHAVQLDPKEQETADYWREKRGLQAKAGGGQVVYLGSPAKRHANLAKTQADYNERWGSYANNNRLSRRLRELRSLNIPRETIELRNNMVANLERDFGRRDETKAA